VLEFDHVRGQKVKNVADLVKDGVRWSLIDEEIGKCDVRCANCHRRRTAAQRSYKAAARQAEKKAAANGR